MAILDKILEWRKAHPRTLEEQAQAPKTIDELSVNINNTLKECDVIIARMKSRENR